MLSLSFDQIRIHKLTDKFGVMGVLIVVLYTLSLPLLDRTPFVELPFTPFVGLVAIAIFSFVLIYPDILLGLFLSGVFTFLFLLTIPRLNSISGWSLIPPLAILLQFLVRRKKIVFPIGAVVILQALFYALMLLGVTYTGRFQEARVKVWHFSYANLMPFVSPMFFVGDAKRLRNIIKSFWLGSIIWGIGGPFYRDVAELRLEPELAGAIGYGRIAAIALVFIACFLVSSHKAKVKAILVPLGGWLLYNMVLTGVRGVLFAFLAAILAAFALKSRSTGAGKYFPVSLLIVTVALALVLAYAPGEITERFTSLDSYEGELHPVSTVGETNRLYFYQEAWDMFLTSPIIGTGISAFRAVANYPHNIFLEVAVELGVVGLAGFFLFIFLTLRYAWQVLSSPYRSDSQRETMLFLFAGFVFYLAEAQFSCSIIQNRAIWFFSGLIWTVYASTPFNPTHQRDLSDHHDGSTSL